MNTLNERRRGMCKHMECVIAWAKGKDIESRSIGEQDFSEDIYPMWHPDWEYRVKKTPRQFWITHETNGMDRIHYTLSGARNYACFGCSDNEVEVIMVEEVL